MTHGYARCSTNEDRQDINRQTRELKKQGVERVWLEFEHGDTISKEQQKLMLNVAEPGDTIITLEVSRLARSTKQLCEIIDIIRDKHLRLIIVGSITMDCRDGQMDPMTEAFLQIAGVFSQLELSMIRERVRSGVQNARAKGKQVSRIRSQVWTGILQFMAGAAGHPPFFTPFIKEGCLWILSKITIHSLPEPM